MQWHNGSKNIVHCERHLFSGPICSNVHESFSQSKVMRIPWPLSSCEVCVTSNVLHLSLLSVFLGCSQEFPVLQQKGASTTNSKGLFTYNFSQKWEDLDPLPPLSSKYQKFANPPSLFRKKIRNLSTPPPPLSELFLLSHAD